MGLRLGFIYGGVGSSIVWVLQVGIGLRWSFGELEVGA